MATAELSLKLQASSGSRIKDFLNANLRLVMREEIRKLQERLHITTVFVTHDQFEAMAISDRLVVMKDGRIEQVGSPIEIYEKPAKKLK